MTFYVTFGQRYRHEPHPYMGHPDGWTEVQAPDYDQARSKVIHRYGNQWACLYDEEDFKRPGYKEMYPKGRLELII